MMASSHVPFAAACWLGYSVVVHTPSTMGQCLIAAFCGLLPDIDSPKSRIGYMLPGISHLIGAVLGHRGFSHSLIATFLLLLTLLYSQLTHAALAMYIAPVIIGYVSHLIGDMCTVKGIPLLWPRRETYAFPLAFKTNSFFEHLLVPPACFIAIYIYYQWVWRDYYPNIGMFIKGLLHEAGIF